METYEGAKKRNRAVAFPVKAEIVECQCFLMEKDGRKREREIEGNGLPKTPKMV